MAAASDRPVTAGGEPSPPAITDAIQDYAKAIYALEEHGGGAVGTRALSNRLGVTPGSASAMLKRLGNLGLITHVPYRGVRLTDAGRRVALQVLRRHRLLERFLTEELGVPWDRVHGEAEVLEHVLSDELAERIDSKLGHPTTTHTATRFRHQQATSRRARRVRWPTSGPASMGRSRASQTRTPRCCGI